MAIVHDSTLETQQNNEDLRRVLDEFLASWGLCVFPASLKYVVGENKGSYAVGISTHETRVLAYKAALELVPDILFTIMTNEDETV